MCAIPPRLVDETLSESHGGIIINRPAVISAAIATLILSLAPATPAFAGQAEREAACRGLGGTLSGNTCTVTTTVVGPPVASGTPTITTGDPKPVGSPTSVDSAPVRQPNPTTDTQERNKGDATSITTYRRGTPVVTEEERNAGDATSESVVVAGTPTIETRTERGRSTTTETPTTINCRRVNNDNAKKPVERCERAVLYTTTTPTTVVTTVTTPQEEVTTTTQPRETVVTTTTPVTEVITTTQPRESCTTTTFQTVITTTTTQPTERTVTTSQPTTVTTTKTTATFRFTGNSDVPTPSGTPTVEPTTAPGAAIITTNEIPGDPVITTSTKAGPEESDVVCTDTAPVITSEDGETTNDVQTAVVPAEPDVNVTRKDLAPLVEETRAPGAPITTTDTRGTGKTCYKNPSTADQRRNRC